MPDPARPPVWFPAAALAFAVAVTQPPVYYSNQHQYFLHGAARAGTGDLTADWLANTADPTPLFTAFVVLAERFTGPAGVYAAFGLLSAVYFLALGSIVSASPHRPRTAAGWILWFGLVVSLHSGAVRAASVALAGWDYPWYAQAGVANQYVLGAGLQPSCVGVLLVAAVGAAGHGRFRAAAALLAAGCTVHSTYLLPAALLTAGWVAVARDRAAVGFGLRTLVGVLPVVAYTLVVFAPLTDPAAAAARTILAVERLPHHCDARRWLDGPAVAQLVWLAAGLALIRRTAWGRGVVVAAALATLLTLAQVGTASPGLALVFPWRLSAVLVPVATAALLAAAVARVERRRPAPLMTAAGVGLTLAAVAGAGWVGATGRAYQQAPAEAGVEAFVAATRRPGEVYLVPTGLPTGPPRRPLGASAFLPVGAAARASFFEFERFRLATGAAVYVDFKSIPYKAADVVEWRRRVADCERWYARREWAGPVAAELRAAGVTHAVVPADVAADLPAEYADAVYRLVRVE